MNDLLSESTPQIMELTLEYSKLAILHNPSEQEADRLGEILAIADEDEVLSFWIAEVDHILGHHLGLLDEDDRESYQDQQSLLREHRGEPICSTPPSEELFLHLRKASLTSSGL